jgi:hypothetical protein
MTAPLTIRANRVQSISVGDNFASGFFDLNPRYKEIIMKRFQSITLCFLALLLLFSAGCASTNEQSSTGEYFDDSVITA